jgi:hypothetical protein
MLTRLSFIWVIMRGFLFGTCLSSHFSPQIIFSSVLKNILIGYYVTSGTLTRSSSASRHLFLQEHNGCMNLGNIPDSPFFISICCALDHNT